MRAIQYLLILFGLTLIGVWALVLAGFIGLMNYQGLVSGFALLNFENPPLGDDPLVGWVFDSFAAGAGFPNWMAAGVTASIFVGSSLLAHLVFRVARLALERREYVRRGDTESAFLASQNIAGDAMWVVVLGFAVACVIWGDLYLFQYRALAGVLNINDPVEAAASIPALGALPSDWSQYASVVFLKSAGFWMYLGISILTPLVLEYVATKMGKYGAALGASFATLPTSSAPNGGEQAVQNFYGYDAAGNPVYDRNTLIAYDVNQNPVGQASTPVIETQQTDVQQNEKAVANDDGVREKLPVIGAQSESSVTLADALAAPHDYHVERATRTIYTRVYWDALHETESTFQPKAKEAA